MVPGPFPFSAQSAHAQHISDDMVEPDRLLNMDGVTDILEREHRYSLKSSVDRTCDQSGFRQKVYSCMRNSLFQLAAMTFPGRLGEAGPKHCHI